MEKLLDILKNVVIENSEFGIYYEIDYSSERNDWSMDVWSEYSENYIFSEYNKDLKRLLKNGIRKIKNFIRELEEE